MRMIWPIVVFSVVALSPRVSAQGRAAEFQAELSRGLELLDDGELDDAIKAFEKANKLADKSSDECYLGLSLAHFHQGDYKDALKNAEKAVAHASTNTHRAKAHYFTGSCLLALDEGDGKKLAEAEPALRVAVDLEPDNASYRYQLGVALLRQRQDEAGIAELEHYLTLAPGAARAEKVRDFIEYPRRAHADYAPEFQLVTAAGEEITSENQRGRVLVIDFWATWCPPCVDAIPDLKKLHAKLEDQPFTLLSISVDEDERAWQDYVAEKDMKWVQFYDEKDEVVKKFLPPRFSIPTYIVIDSEGIIRDRFSSGRREFSKLKREINKALEEIR